MRKGHRIRKREGRDTKVKGEKLYEDNRGKKISQYEIECIS